MTDSFLPPVDIPGVSKANILNYFGKGNFANLNDEVQVLCEVPDYVKFVSFIL